MAGTPPPMILSNTSETAQILEYTLQVWASIVDQLETNFFFQRLLWATTAEVKSVWDFNLRDIGQFTASQRNVGLPLSTNEVWLDARVLGDSDDAVQLLRSSVQVPADGLKVTCEGIRLSGSQSLVKVTRKRAC